MKLDLAIKNGLIIDGTGSAGFYADVGIKDGTIVQIGRLDSNANEVILSLIHI